MTSTLESAVLTLPNWPFSLRPAAQT